MGHRIIWGAVVWVLLSACGENVSQPSPAKSEVIKEQPKFTTRTVQVELTQGTNMAVAVRGQDRVVSLQGQLFYIGADGKSRAISDAYHDAREPQFRQDGLGVWFQGYKNGNWDIFSLDLVDGKPRALTSDAYDDREPVSGVDGTVVFSSDRGGSYDIWQLELATGGLTQLTNTENNSYSPSAFVRTDKPMLLAYVNQQAASAAVVVRDGEQERVVAEEMGQVSGVMWSPDGTHISYQVIKGDISMMRVVDVDSGSVRTVSAPGDDVFPFRGQWLDPHTLVYTANGLVVKNDVSTQGAVEDWPFKVEVELQRHDYARRTRDYSSEIKRPALGLTSPQISNDGETIYFTGLGDLWRWQPALDQLTNLTDDGAADFAPALSPDNTKLAFVSDRDGAVGLYVMDLQSAQTTKVEVNAQQISQPAWSPDSAQLAFFVDVPGNPLGGQLVLFSLADKSVTPVLEPMPAQPVTWSADGQRVAITRLNPFSSKYREGVYELVITEIASGQTRVVSPHPHKSIVHAGLTPDGAMSYVQGARLYRLELDEDLAPLESAGQVTQELTDFPSWSANGDYLVYLSGQSLKRVDFRGGGTTDITPQLSYQLATPQDQYILRLGQVFTATSDASIPKQDIWIKGNRIEKVSPWVEEVPSDYTLVDLSEFNAVPGLFEMHAHMGETSEVQGRIWLANGITTVRDPGSNPYVAKERQEAWDSGRRLGPRTHITGFLTDGNRVFYSMAEGIVSDEHLRDALNRTEQLQLDFIKTYVRLSDDWQLKVVEFAHGLGIPVSSHELYPAAAHGMDHVEHIGGTSRRGYQPKVSRLGHSYQDVVALLSASGMGITATAVLPGFAVIVAQEQDWFETPQFEHFYGPKVRKGYELMVPRFGAAAASVAQANGGLLTALTESGALLVTGTDSPFVPYGSGLHAEFRLYARAGVPNAEILKQATIRSAYAAGVDAELGSIEAGKLADIVIVRGDPLQDIRNLDQVVMTVKNGEQHTLESLLVDP